MTKSFITGVDGFIGSWLAQELLSQGDQVFGLSQSKSGNFDGVVKHKADLTSAEEINKIIKQVKPDRLFHLAAQSNIPASFKNPQETIDVNVNGSLNLLEAIRLSSPKTVFISVGSSAEYGLTAHQHSILKEDMPLAPSSPYGISKATQGYFSALYHRAYQIKTIHVRPFAIVGPRKTRDALCDFCQGIVQIESGTAKKLPIGNLEAIRDFIDVRDMIKILIVLSEKGKWGEIYNICSGKGMNLSQILDMLKKISSAKIKTIIDETRSRPADDLTIVGDPSKLLKIGFKFQYSIESSINDTLSYWREQNKPKES